MDEITLVAERKYDFPAISIVVARDTYGTYM